MSNSNPSESTNEFLTGMGEHIEELRKRLLIAFLTLITAVIASFFFARPLMNWLALPVGGLSALQSIEITENMTAAMNVSLLCGIILASPMVFYQFLAFVLPGLKENEKRMVWLFLPAMILFFLIGALFAFYVILP
ncbi:MAG: preprotein translocase subunit TatC, partial [Chloroflexi bacterium]|nr:preprotein translocase subunit TatC [Chloroflexota bacterium]